MSGILSQSPTIYRIFAPIVIHGESSKTHHRHSEGQKSRNTL